MGDVRPEHAWLPSDVTREKGVAMNKFLVALQQFATERLGRDERGASAVEYAILVAVIAVVVIAAVWIFGDELADFFGGLLPDNTDRPAGS